MPEQEVTDQLQKPRRTHLPVTYFSLASDMVWGLSQLKSLWWMVFSCSWKKIMHPLQLMQPYSHTSLVLLDLSADYDTVDHHILFEMLCVQYSDCFSPTCWTQKVVIRMLKLTVWLLCNTFSFSQFILIFNIMQTRDHSNHCVCMLSICKWHPALYIIK